MASSRALLELTPAADRATVNSHIAALDAGGGTFLYPALEDAHERLTNSNARRKHVIVLSDGQTQGFGYEELVHTMAYDGITLSAIGIGDGADMNPHGSHGNRRRRAGLLHQRLLQHPADLHARGAARVEEHAHRTPRAAGRAIDDDPALAEIDTDELPLLTGYVATTPKAAANLILVSDSGDPLLANWRCGLGRTAAFTSETKPRWAEDWLDWPDFAKFWSQLVRSVTGENLSRAYSLECSHHLDGTSVALSADVRDADGDFVTNAAVTLHTLDASGRTREIPAVQQGPGLFEARVPEIIYGTDQQFSWRLRVGDGEEQPVSYGFTYSFSPEFRSLGVDNDTLEQIRTRANGEFLTVGQTHLTLGDPTGSRWIQLWPYLLISALVLVPVRHSLPPPGLEQLQEQSVAPPAAQAALLVRHDGPRSAPGRHQPHLEPALGFPDQRPLDEHHTAADVKRRATAEPP